MDHTGQWVVQWYPFMAIECRREGPSGDYRIRTTVDTEGSQTCAEQIISGEVLYYAHDPSGIIKEVMMATLEACGVPPQDVERLVDERQRTSEGVME